MVPGDDRAAAARETEALADGRVRCFWDADHLAGRTWSKEFAANHADALREAFAGDARAVAMVAALSAPFDEVPAAWDCAFFYRPGVTWPGAVPKPVAWTKQSEFRDAETGREASGRFWTGRSPRALVDSAWPEEIALGFRAVVEPRR